MHIIPIFRKGRRKNSLKLYLSLRRLVFRFLSFTGERHFSRIRLMAPFCYLQSKDSVLLFPGAWLNWRPSLANVCPELTILPAGEGTRSFCYKSARLFTPTSVLKLKILFQISSDEKVLFFWC